MGAFHFFARRQYPSYSSPPEKSKNHPIFHNTKLKCLGFQGIFLFRFLLSRGIYIHLPLQENEIQPIYQFMFVLPRKAKFIPFINFILLFRRGELCSPLCFCFYTVTIKKRTEFPSAFIYFSITPGQEQPSGFSGGKNSSTGNSTP